MEVGGYFEDDFGGERGQGFFGGGGCFGTGGDVEGGEEGVEIEVVGIFGCLALCCWAGVGWVCHVCFGEEGVGFCDDVDLVWTNSWSQEARRSMRAEFAIWNEHEVFFHTCCPGLVMMIVVWSRGRMSQDLRPPSPRHHSARHHTSRHHSLT